MYWACPPVVLKMADGTLSSVELPAFAMVKWDGILTNTALSEIIHNRPRTESYLSYLNLAWATFRQLFATLFSARSEAGSPPRIQLAARAQFTEGHARQQKENWRAIWESGHVIIPEERIERTVRRLF